MSHNEAREERRAGLGWIAGRKRQRQRGGLRPTLLMLEDRQMLSTVVVNSPVDNVNDAIITGPTVTLREAINYENANGGGSITFDSTVFSTPQTINLTLGQLDLSDTTGTETITGPAAGVTVSADTQSRVFQVDSGVTASISGLTITGGNTAGGGGGLYNDNGTTTLTNVTISGNTAAYGGGIDNSGTATLTNVTISDNNGGDGGGGLFNTGTVTLTDCTISGNAANAAGGLSDYRGAATLVACTVTGNTVAEDGGGIKSSDYGTITLSNTIVAGNTAGANSPDVEGAISSDGNNLIGQTDGSSGWVSTDLTGTSAQPLDPVLAPWATTAARRRPWPSCPVAPPSARRGRERHHHRPARQAARRAQPRHRRLPEPGLHLHNCQRQHGADGGDRHAVQSAHGDRDGQQPGRAGQRRCRPIRGSFLGQRRHRDVLDPHGNPHGRHQGRPGQPCRGAQQRRRQLRCRYV